MTKWKLLILTLCGILMLSAPLSAEVVEEIDGGGKVDWEEGYVYATAIGTAPEGMVNEVHAEQVALKTARDLAKAELNETVNNIAINSKTIYKQQLMSSDILKTLTYGVLKNSHVVEKKFSWTPKGSPRAEVTVRLPIDGGLSRAVGHWAREQVETQPQLPKFEPAAAAAPPENYTGLIVDCAGTGVKPVLDPKILTSDGAKEVFGSRDADLAAMSRMSLMGYTDSVEKAKRNDRVGANPLIVKAQKAMGAKSGDVLVSEGDAKKILSADIGANFLSGCGVVIVVR